MRVILKVAAAPHMRHSPPGCRPKEVPRTKGVVDVRHAVSATGGALDWVMLTAPWGLLVQRGSLALVDGRFRECERLAAEAARAAGAGPEPGLLAAACCREQGRAAEADVLLRGLVAAHPEAAEAQALLGAVLCDLGRDGEALRQLATLEARPSRVEVAALAAEVVAALDLPDHAEALHHHLAAHGSTFAGWHGSIARHLALLDHVLGRWDDAEEHFRRALDANYAAGAPVLVAHTRRQYSALLRARGGPGDWERAVDLLGQAATIYRRLEVERLADQAEVVLRRCLDPGGDLGPAGEANLFRRAGNGWELAFAGQRAEIGDGAGLGHIAAVLAASGRPVQVLDLVGADEPAVADGMVVEYRARLADIDRQMAGNDLIAAALARAERDILQAELDEARSAAGDPVDRARRLVALRVRTTLDGIESALPVLGRHLRRSIRTGTFCVYEPDRPERWKIG